jgi:hypothetical protein
MGVNWTVRGYLAVGRSVIEEWLQGASDDAQAKLDSRLLMLCQLELAIWKHDHAHQLHGECDGLFELKFRADRIAHRPLCCFGPRRREFTILLFATEHNNRLRPPGACASALARCVEITANPERARVYDGYKPQISGETDSPDLSKDIPPKYRH